MTGAAIARKFGVATKTVTHDWVLAGCPRNADKSFDLDLVLAWRKAKLNEAANDPAVKAAGHKAALQAKRLMLQCEQLEVVLARDKGRLHDKHACALSLTSVVSESLQPLLSVGSRLAAQFPELGQRLRDAADKEIDAVLQQIRDGLK
jgi:phage terminase Nu1 subunit (DNA packaging protein)